MIIPLILISTSLEAAELHVSSTKNLKGMLIEISELFENKNTEWKVNLRTGKSAELAKLIANGTSTDLFLLNDEKTVRDLKRKKKIQNVKRFLADDLVVVGSATSKLEISDPGKLTYPELKTIALFNEKHPGGKVARDYLKKINLLDTVQAKISSKKNTKEILNAITTAQADWGIVYASDVANEKAFKVLWKIPEADATSQIYYAGTVTNSQNQEGARLFLETLHSTIATKIFENSGLRPIKN
ncbi:molybdate ABC transporter substrate-binding protein [bacterium]|nr:molybdate ABC transporter substrate-binding protein [bacterium]MCI0605400.1 molybdate ABC transporter substrate-binding protein [bacterium]